MRVVAAIVSILAILVWLSGELNKALSMFSDPFQWEDEDGE